VPENELDVPLLYPQKEKRRENGGREYRNHKTWNLRQVKRLDKKSSTTEKE